MTSRSPVQLSTQLGTKERSKNITLSADSPEEMKALLDQLLAVADGLVGDLVELDQVILGKSVVGTVGVPDNTPTQVSAVAPTVPPPGVAPGPAPRCNHGERVFKSGQKANGGSWKAWFCPTEKGTPDQCEPEWVR